MKITDLKAHMVAPDFNVIYSYCLDGAISIEFEDYFIQLWPEIMCFTVEFRGNRIPRERFYGRIIKWDKAAAVIEFELTTRYFLECREISKEEFPNLELRLAYMFGYLNVKNFCYEKKYDEPFARR